MTTVAVIPARGGSKGIPGKNLIPFCGKPLMVWSIEQALDANGIDSVWVSSDSDEILDVAEQSGARGIKRPKSISGDMASSESAWLHALDELEARGLSVDAMVGVQATSPVRVAEDIERGIQVFFESDCDSLFSAAPLGDFLIWQKAAGDGLRSMNYDYHNRSRRQDFSEQYVENGSFYIFTPQLIRRDGNRLGGKIGMSTMEFWKSFEIDEPEDVAFCALLMKHYILQGA